MLDRWRMLQSYAFWPSGNRLGRAFPEVYELYIISLLNAPVISARMSGPGHAVEHGPVA